jgi:hypothetical protein
MNTTPPGQQWPPQTVLRVHHGMLIDAPMVPTPGSRTWAATVWPDQRAPGGWGRAVMAPGLTGRGYLADGITPGDVVEFGADYPTQTGRKRIEMVARRWYGVILATAPTHVVACGPFPGPEPARQWAEAAMLAWRRSLEVDIAGITDPAGPAPALSARRDATTATPTVEVHTRGQFTRVDDPTHGRLVVDAALFGAAMDADTARLVGLLAEARDPTGHLVLTGRESKPTLAALAALHAPEHLTFEAATVATRPGSATPVNGPDLVYYGHPDGTVERVDHRGTTALRPARRWSPDGFAWGYQGDSPTELAYALLADSTGSNEVARRLAVAYGAEVIADLPQGQAWSLPAKTVAAWADAAQQQRPPIPATRRAADHDVGAGL